MPTDFLANAKPVKAPVDFLADATPASPSGVAGAPAYLPQPAAHPSVTMQPTGLAGRVMSGGLNLIHSLGVPTAAEGEQQRQDAIAHPGLTLARAAAGPIGQVAEGAVRGGIRSAGELKQAASDFSSGNTSGAGLHAISAIPVIGPGFNRAMDSASAAGAGKTGQSYLTDLKKTVTDPETMGTIAGTAAQAAPMVEGGLDATRKAASLVPTKSHAAGVFRDIENAAQNVPVAPKMTAPALQDFRQTVATGGKNAPVMTKLQSRISPPAPKGNMLTTMQNNLNGTPPVAQPAPLLFPEARDFYTNISRATAKPGFLRSAIESPQQPSFRMNAGNVREALKSDLTDAADTVGRGKDYTAATNEYRRAAQLSKALKIGGSLAAGEALRRTGLLGKVVGKVAE
jgi:hypothetical protein